MSIINSCITSIQFCKRDTGECPISWWICAVAWPRRASWQVAVRQATADARPPSALLHDPLLPVVCMYLELMPRREVHVGQGLLYKFGNGLLFHSAKLYGGSDGFHLHSLILMALMINVSVYCVTFLRPILFYIWWPLW